MLFLCAVTAASGNIPPLPLKQRLSHQTWRQIVVKVYVDLPQNTVESDWLPRIRKTQAARQPE